MVFIIIVIFPALANKRPYPVDRVLSFFISLLVYNANRLTTTPVVLYAFARLSLVSLLTNFLILPAQPGVMMWGGMVTLLGLVWLPLGQAVGWVAWLFLTYTVQIVEVTARIPFAAVEVQRPSGIVMWLYYALLLGWLP